MRSAPKSWAMLVDCFATQCAAADASEQLDLLREAGKLFGFEGPAFAHVSDPDALFERMLACGAFESAAIAVLPNGAGFLLSRGANGSCLASVILADQQVESTAAGVTPALALLGAYAQAALDELDDS